MTGLLAIIVLLVVMNWFFHKVYWTGWISLHTKKKKKLMTGAGDSSSSRGRLLWGLGILGFTSLYREGFEVVLFLQSYKLHWGSTIVMDGVGLGLLFTVIVAILTFVAHQRLPYRKMLVLTGVLLGGVLLVMVGEQAQEMQQALWIPTHNIHWLGTRHPQLGWTLVLGLPHRGDAGGPGDRRPAGGRLLLHGPRLAGRRYADDLRIAPGAPAKRNNHCTTQDRLVFTRPLCDWQPIDFQ